MNRPQIVSLLFVLAVSLVAMPETPAQARRKVTYNSSYMVTKYQLWIAEDPGVEHVVYVWDRQQNEWREWWRGTNAMEVRMRMLQAHYLNQRAPVQSAEETLTPVWIFVDAFENRANAEQQASSWQDVSFLTEIREVTRPAYDRGYPPRG